jgi:putative toxin-antitoxin system antitoxin component (TIGR02293 family)
MGQPKKGPKSDKTGKGPHSSKKKLSIAGEPAQAYGKSEPKQNPGEVVFKVTRGGKQKSYPVDAGYGFFVVSFRRATNINQISEVVEQGISSKEIEPIVQYLDFKIPEIAKAAAVSPSTVSRWAPGTSIGAPGTNQFFKIDEVIKKGVDVFGSPEEFKVWLNIPNLALGNQTPAKILTSQIGVELVDEALDALHFGTVM